MSSTEIQGSQLVVLNMATRKRVLTAEGFYRNHERSVRLKAEKVRPKIPDKMVQEK